MKVFGLVLAALPLLLSLSIALAQVPQEAKSVQDFSKVFYRNTPQGRIPEAVCSGSEATPLEGSKIQIKNFKLEVLREATTTNFTALSPECVIDVKEDYATSPGPLQGFNANTNFYIEGVGFIATKTNSLLVISNQVQTRIVKAAMKGSLPLANARTQTTPAQQTPTNEVLRIFSDHFRLLYQSNLATYIGHVRVVDSRMTLTCELLKTKFTTNGAIQNIVAEQNVVLTQTNGSKATGDRGVYTVVGTNETVELIGHAHWDDGEHLATARSFFYDGRTDELKANDGVKVRFPNGAHRAPRSENDFSELFANTATISNATRKHAKTQDIHAEGDVMTTNHFDHSSAQSFRAVYSETNGIVELAGNPKLSNGQGEISGYVVSMDRSNNVFRSRGNTLAVLNYHDSASRSRAPMTIRIRSTDLDYTTNEAHFSGHVEGVVLQNNIVAGELTCQDLVLHLAASNQVVKVVAEGDVFVQKPSALGHQNLHCDLLTVNRNPKSGFLRDATADGHCLFTETNNSAKSEVRMLTADKLFAEFSPVTNKVERFTAEGPIVGSQIKAARTNQVHGTKLVYTAEPVEKIDVTGNPKAITERAIISNANLFTWLVKSGTFRATGPYKIVPTPRSNTVLSR